MAERIFIYDDDDSMLHGLKSIAMDEGCDVVACATPRDVMAAFGGGSINRAIVDKGAEFMPGLIGHRGGLGVVRMLVDNFDTLAMVISGEGMTGVDEIRASGASCFVSKAAEHLDDYITQFIRRGTIQVFPEDIAFAGNL